MGNSLSSSLSNNIELDAVFSSMDGSNHILHLYSPAVNKFLIHASFLSNGNGKTAYVTGDDPGKIEKKFNLLKIKLSVLHPKDLNKAMEYDRVVVDCASIDPGVIKKEERKRLGEEQLMEEYIDHHKRERHLNENFKNQSVLCTYDVSKLNPKELKNLVIQHSKLILSTDSSTIMTSKSLSSKKLLNSVLIEQFVKRELKTIVLALVSRMPMCGRDIKLEIYKRFNILLSSGTLYPLLHELEQNSLLKCHDTVKTKIYEPNDENQIRRLLDEHMQVKNFMNEFLQSAVSGAIKRRR